MDDTDIRIAYTGNWESYPQNNPLNSNSTLTYTNVSGDTATVTFNGKSVTDIKGRVETQQTSTAGWQVEVQGAIETGLKMQAGSR